MEQGLPNLNCSDPNVTFTGTGVEMQHTCLGMQLTVHGFPIDQYLTCVALTSYLNLTDANN